VAARRGAAVVPPGGCSADPAEHLAGVAAGVRLGTLGVLKEVLRGGGICIADSPRSLAKEAFGCAPTYARQAMLGFARQHGRHQLVVHQRYQISPPYHAFHLIEKLPASGAFGRLNLA
jgi:hypothetical protein